MVDGMRETEKEREEFRKRFEEIFGDEENEV
jgi:hypothetical protein